MEVITLKNIKDKLLSPFKLQLNGKGVSKNENISPSGIKRFFISLKNNFNKIVGINIIIVIGNFPLIFLVALLAGYTKDTSFLPANDMLQNVFGIVMIEGHTPSSMTLFALESLSDQISIFTTLSYVFLGISALALLTFGVVNTGTTYVLRNIAMGEPAFVWSDFIYAVKRNYKQAFIIGFFDVAVHAILIFNIFTTISGGDFIVSMLFWANIVLAVLFSFMRSYMYIQVVTFDLTVFKIIKNSLSFAMIGLKRNAAALAGTLLLVILEGFFIFSLGGIFISLGVAFPLAVMFSFVAYMNIFAAYYKIKEVIIDPYKKDHPDEFMGESVDEEIIMLDDVTQNEKLEKIKNSLANK